MENQGLIDLAEPIAGRLSVDAVALRHNRP